MTIARNEPSFDPAVALLYQDAVNLDGFAGAVPYAAKIMNISGQRQADIGTVYWRVAYEIQFRRETFAVPILDRGFRKLLANGSLQQIKDSLDHSSLANPVLLNGRGQPSNVAVGNLNTAMTATTDLAVTNAYPNNWPPLADGGFPAPPHGYFECRIDNEVMQVRHVFGGSSTWVVERGWAGTNPAAHGAGSKITLEPYYLRFLPFKALNFSELNLPII